MISAENQYQSTIDTPKREAHPSVTHCQGEKTAIEHPLVSIVDDDESVRESLPDLLRELGFAARAFSSAQQFLSSDCVDETRCLILDVAMPSTSGPELQQELKRLGKEIPIIFVTGRSDETIRAQVFKQGAAAFLLKPFSDSALLAAIKKALHAS
jgi:FixJ family two-component response regulator